MDEGDDSLLPVAARCIETAAQLAVSVLLAVLSAGGLRPVVSGWDGSIDERDFDGAADAADER